MLCLDLKKKLGLKTIRIYRVSHLESKTEINFGLEEAYLENKSILLKMLSAKIIMFTETLSSNL
jgi:hypothetical protein